GLHATNIRSGVNNEAENTITLQEEQLDTK
ncbi:MAG: hypothetical protein ACJAYG_002831, partial [Oceanicoccus sp.]